MPVNNSAPPSEAEAAELKPTSHSRLADIKPGPQPDSAPLPAAAEADAAPDAGWPQATTAFVSASTEEHLAAAGVTSPAEPTTQPIAQQAAVPQTAVPQPAMPTTAVQELAETRLVTTITLSPERLEQNRLAEAQQSEAASVAAPAVASPAVTSPAVASPTVVTPTVAQPTGAKPKKPPRDGFIDTLRAVALIRVMVWHALGDSVISWVITTMPLMFFVAGSLLHSSMERTPVLTMLRRRLRRLLVPFWFFGAIVLTVCAVVDLRSQRPGTSFGLGQLWAWIVPLVNPTASAWEAGWASAPLWYLRAYLWILLLSPVILWAWRRFAFGSLLGGMAIMAVGHAVSLQTNAGPGALIWIVGDLGIYGFFVLLGFAHHAGRLSDLTPRDLLEWLGVALCATYVAWQLWPSADGVVNHSYPTLLAYGCAWICLSLLARPLLSKSMQVPILGPVLYWMTRRAMSIYLWHSPGIVASYWILSKIGVAPSAVPVIGLTIVFVVITSTVTGWIEDVAGGRSPELIPLPKGVGSNRTIEVPAALDSRRRSMLTGIAIGAVATIVVASVAVDSNAMASPNGDVVASQSGDAGLALPPAPSGRPDANANTGGANAGGADSGLALPPAPSGRPDPNAGSDDSGLGLPPAPSGRPDPNANTTAPAAATDASPVATGSVQTIIDTWRVERGVAGVRVGISNGGEVTAVLSGTDKQGESLTLDAELEVTSITKTMTAAIVLQLVDEGRIALDEPLPPLTALGGVSPEAPVTVRQLLMHSAGLVPYQSAAGYDPASSLTPETAVLSAMQSPLEWTPGTAPGYSNSGFLTLGLLIEQVTRQPYETVLDERILGPFSLEATSLDQVPRRGWVGDSAGGLLSTVPDLLRWGNALYRTKQVLSPEQTAAMMRVDHDLASGLGAFPVCPCDYLGDGSMTYTSIGHNGGSVSMQYAPTNDILIVATFTESFWTEELTQQDVYELFETLRAAA